MPTTSGSVGRAFSSAAIELALANIPGFFATSVPGPAQSYGVYWPALVPADEIDQVVVMDDGRRIRIPAAADAMRPAAEPVVAPARARRGAGAGRARAAARALVRRPLR